MPTDVLMPQMGESIFEGTITKWLKKPGDTVQRDEPLFEISTDKVDAEIPAPASGVLQEIKVMEGATVGVNTIVGTIAADGESAATKPAQSAPAKSTAPERKEEVRSATADTPASSQAPSPSHPKLHPKTRKRVPLRWSARSPVNMASIWPKFPAQALVEGSRSRTFLVS